MLGLYIECGIGSYRKYRGGLPLKKLFTTLLALTLSLCLTTPAVLADEAMWDGHTNAMRGPGGTYVDGFWSNVDWGLSNFKRVRDYVPGVYADVPAGAWYEENLRIVYEMGLTEDAAAFLPGGGLTLAEVVSLAVRVHRTYNGWSASALSDLEYALNTGIVTIDQYGDYSAPATRRSFAAIMAKALPGEALRGVNAVVDGAIPDVPMSDPGAAGIYALYRSGVLLGVDARGTFRPDSPITRTAAAVALSRMTSPSLRQSISLLAMESYQVTLEPSGVVMLPGTVRTLNAIISPANAADKRVVWVSSDPLTAAVDQTGTVTAIQPGTTVISAISIDGAVGTCAVQVSESFPGYGIYPNGFYQWNDSFSPPLTP